VEVDIMERSGVKVGKVNREIAKALGTTFSGNLNIYLDEGFLRQLSKRYPTTYLAKVEEISKLISHPDYALYAEQEETIYLIKDHYKTPYFSKVYLEVKRGEEWYVKNCASLSNDVLTSLASKGQMKRANL
jgi:hypothetical protein